MAKAKRHYDRVVSALRDRRKAMGLSLQGLSDKTAGVVALCRVSQIERGIWRPRSRVLDAYAAALGVDTQTVLREFPKWPIYPHGGSSYKKPGRWQVRLPPEFYRRAERVLRDFDVSLEEWLVEVGTERLDEIEGRGARWPRISDS